MEDKINIAKLLKDAPSGTKLYSPIYGECNFEYIYETKKKIYIEIYIKDEGCMVVFDRYGRRNDNGECMLFPSKECRTWKNFKPCRNHQKFQPFEKVLVKRGKHCRWRAAFYSHYDPDLSAHITSEGRFSDDEILPYDLNKDKLGQKIE